MDVVNTSPTPLSAIRRRLAFSLVLLSGVAASMVYSALAPILPLLASHFDAASGGRGELAAQLGMTMPSLGIILGGAMSGTIVARFGLRRVILFSLIGFGGFGVSGGLLHDIWSFCATRLALGVCGALLTTACVTLLANLYEDKARLKMVGYWKAAMTLSAIPTTIGAGLIADFAGLPAVFGMFAVFAIPALALAYFATPRRSVRTAPALAGAATPVGLWRLWPVLLMILGLHIAIMSGSFQIPFALAQMGTGSATAISLIMSAGAVLGGAGSVLSGHLQARFGQARVLWSGVLVLASGVLLVGVAPTLAFIVAGACLMGLATGLCLPFYVTLTLCRVAPDQHSSAIGWVQVSMYLGAFLNPIVLAPVRAAVGPQGVFLTIGLLLVFALGISFAFNRTRWRLLNAGA